MNTPICDFINSYISSGCTRLHMPGHKGVGAIESLDITEINGVDSLYSDSGIISESEKNASSLFGSYKTCYSTEGSSQCIKAMLHLAKMYKNPSTRGYILATRNAHNSLIAASFALDFDIHWIRSNANDPYVSCSFSPSTLDMMLDVDDKPFAVFVTSPDYLGNVLDIRKIAQICEKHNTILIVDNAHGAYLKFLEPSMHPLHQGAHMCCDSAHKTLPALTGAAYLHIGNSAGYELRSFLSENVKRAMALYGSSSPSFLTLRSLDMINAKIASGELIKAQNDVISALDELAYRLSEYGGYTLVGQEKLKITINASEYGYTGKEFNDILEQNGVFVEFFDKRFVTLMFSCNTEIYEISRLEDILINIPRLEPLFVPECELCTVPRRVMSIREAILSKSERVHINDAFGRVLASPTVSCPPCVSIVVCGEVIDKQAQMALSFYGFEYVYVVK